MAGQTGARSTARREPARARRRGWRRLALSALCAAGALLGTAAAQPAPPATPPAAPRPAAPAPGDRASRPLDALLAEVDRHTIAASDAALARALGVLGLEPSSEPITRADVERMVDARLLAEEGRRLDLATDAAAVDAAWTEAAERLGGPAEREAWLAAARVPPEWARALVEQDVLRRRFIEERFRAFSFVGESDIDAAMGGAGGDAAAREAVRRRLTDEAVARGVADWLADARKRAKIRILLPPGATAPLVVPMPGRPALRSGGGGRMVTVANAAHSPRPEDPDR
jgi:hypothetical protein